MHRSKNRDLLNHPSALASVPASRFKERDDFGARLGRGEAAIGFHVVAGHHLVGIFNEAVERCS